MTPVFGDSSRSCSPRTFISQASASSCPDVANSTADNNFLTAQLLLNSIKQELMKIQHGDSQEPYVEFSYVRDINLANKLYELLEHLEYRSRLRVTIIPKIGLVRIHQKMPSDPHENASETLGHYLMSALEQIELDFVVRYLPPFGASRKRVPNGASKEPDKSWVPDQRPSAVPSIVLETGLLESLLQLQKDANLWLDHFPDVVTVLLLKIYPVSKTFHFEKWKRTPLGNVAVVAWQHGLDDIPSAPAITLTTLDLFLPNEVPAILQQLNNPDIIIPAARVQLMIEKALSLV